EHTASKRNLPRKWILPDEVLVDIARREPSSLESLYRTRGLKERLGKTWSYELLDVIKTARALPPERWPTPNRRPSRDSRQTARLGLMNTLLHQRSKELSIAASFLAPHEDMVRLAAGQREGLDLLRGWRRDLLGNELLRLLDGEVSLSLDGYDLKVTLLSQADSPPPQ
ncbi:MAG: HRDC domain-containing protein, partial [Coriobacteriales bacterium]|nr:HRDC domain-containing protein [Coriobacteriales bacterium]